MVAPRDQVGQLARPGQVDRDGRPVDAEHLADHPPAVVVVLGLPILHAHTQAAQRVDDDRAERHQRAGQVLLADRDAVGGRIPAVTCRHEVPDRGVQQPDFLDLADAASTRRKRPRRHHRQDELRRLADAAHGLVVQAAAEGQHLDAGIAGVAVHERPGSQRPRTPAGRARRPSVQPRSNRSGSTQPGSSAVSRASAAIDDGSSSGNRWSLSTRWAKHPADRANLLRARELTDKRRPRSDPRRASARP